MITWAAYGKEKLKWLQYHHEDLMDKAKKVEAQNIDPELEYELSKSRELSKPDQP